MSYPSINGVTWSMSRKIIYHGLQHWIAVIIVKLSLSNLLQSLDTRSRQYKEILYSSWLSTGCLDPTDCTIPKPFWQLFANLSCLFSEETSMISEEAISLACLYTLLHSSSLLNSWSVFIVPSAVLAMSVCELWSWSDSCFVRNINQLNVTRVLRNLRQCTCSKIPVASTALLCNCHQLHILSAALSE